VTPGHENMTFCPEFAECFFIEPCANGGSGARTQARNWTRGDELAGRSAG